ncbi:hypothetical protein [Moorena sp. SIO3H5]|uniref:hypothetical protein n=1 Tax=Moorena sp. SIO3H5 TaxID=2607834 RepID=UPI0013B78DC8|nr:hypothetical protein [Moorena sp. SIO3H5]NEO71680.1 hypothetical protein [Moorena sp. SIO3H5]
MISLPEQGFFPAVTSIPKNINLESIRQKAKGKFISRTPYSLLPTPCSLLPTPINRERKYLTELITAI